MLAFAWDSFIKLCRKGSMDSKSKCLKDHSFNPTFKGFRRIEVIFFLFVWLFCFVIQVGAESLQYQEARERFEKGEFLLAMLAAQQAVEESSENAAYRHLYGAILLELKQHSEGEINLRKAVELDPDNAEFLYTLADLLITQKSDVAIMKELRTGIGQPRFGNVDQEGVELLKRAIKLNPEHFKARHRLGRAYTDLNRHDLALEQFQAIADKNPRYPWIHSSLAVIYIDEGSVEEAIKSLKKEIELYPEHHSARLELGEVLLKFGDSEQALKELLAVKEEALFSKDKPALYLSLSKAYRDIGKLEKALTRLKQSIALDGNVPNAYYLGSQIYQQMGKPALARQQMVKFQKVYREERQKKLGFMDDQPSSRK